MSSPAGTDLEAGQSPQTASPGGVLHWAGPPLRLTPVMAKARAIVKRRKAVRNIRKITRTMQMIATAKFQKALKRAVGTKPYTLKVRELVMDLLSSVGEIRHPLMRVPGGETASNRLALIVITSNRGLAGGYNGNVLRTASAFIRQQEAAGKSIELHLSGKKGVTFFNYQKRPIAHRYEQFADQPRYSEVERIAGGLMDRFVEGQIDGLYVAFMNFLSASTQKPEVLKLLPLEGARAAAEHLAQQAAEVLGSHERLSALDARQAGVIAGSGIGRVAKAQAHVAAEVQYDFSPGPRELLDYLLPLTVKTALFQCFLDATTSENVARMVSMKSATDNADQIEKVLTMRYNRARQSQITTELSEIMGGVEAMKS